MPERFSIGTTPRKAAACSADTSYRVKFPGVAELIEEHPPKRQQQAAAAKAPLTGVKRDYLYFFIADRGLRLIRAGGRQAEFMNQ